MNNQLAIIVLLVILVVLVAVNIWLYRHYRRNIKKVTFLFDAIDNGDFSFGFPTEKRFKEDNILHQSLNRIKLFLQHTREEQMVTTTSCNTTRQLSGCSIRMCLPT